MTNQLFAAACLKSGREKDHEQIQLWNIVFFIY